MKIITEPTVHLVTVPILNHEAVDEFTDANGGATWPDELPTDCDSIPEVAGRTCYMSFKAQRPGGNKAYLDHILEVGHGSVLEHTNIGMILEGISRSLSHELVRHRAGFAYSQLSQRYVDESDVAFVLPPELLDSYQMAQDSSRAKTEKDLLDRRLSTDLYLTWKQACEMALSYYKSLSGLLEKTVSLSLSLTERKKAIRQTARAVLPNCTETKIFVTGNARAWRHFLEQRGSRHADAEIRRLAFTVLAELQVVAPNLFSDYHVTAEADVPEIVTQHRKV